MMKQLMGAMNVEPSPDFTEHECPYIIEVGEGASLDHVPIRREVMILGSRITISYGKVRVFTDSIFFHVGEEDVSSFHFLKKVLVSVMMEDGRVIWENSRKL